MAKKKYDFKLKGYVGGWDFDEDYVDWYLNRHSDAEVNVLINSLGGDVATAFAISSAFRAHGNVNVHYVGMNASAATIASLGAKRVTIDANAMYLVHKCSSFVFKWDMLNSDQLQQLIDECEKTKRDLDKIDLNIASAYAARCKKDKAQLLELMKEGAWLLAEEALEWGFVDEITDLPEDSAPKIDDDVLNFMNSAGIPVPENMKPVVEKKPNILQRILDAVTGSKVVNKTSQKMKKVCQFICALFAIEALTIEDGKITLTDDQVQKIEDELSRLNGELTARDTEISNLRCQVEALQKKPAETSNHVVETSKSDAPVNDFATTFKNAQELFKQIS